MNYVDPYNQFTNQSVQPPENAGKAIGKVMLTQLSIFAGYQLLLVAFIKMSNGSGFLIWDIFPLVLHWLFLLVMMIVMFSSKRKGAGLGYLISLLVIVVIGFGSCWGISSLVDNHFMF